jgi:thiol-disulfide isomerase/thioredoxin
VLGPTLFRYTSPAALSSAGSADNRWCGNAARPAALGRAAGIGLSGISHERSSLSAGLRDINRSVNYLLQDRTALTKLTRFPRMASMTRVIRNRRDLTEVLKSNDRVFILFYASWCPFSLAFLPIYEKHADVEEPHFARMILQDNEDLFAEYSIEVYPTVIFFRAGKVHQRLDGKHLAGLREQQLTDLIESCRTDKG